MADYTAEMLLQAVCGEDRSSVLGAYDDWKNDKRSQTSRMKVEGDEGLQPARKAQTNDIARIKRPRPTLLSRNLTTNVPFESAR